MNPQTFDLINPKDISDNMISLIGDKWMLVTAGNSSCFNTMTASWGMMGFLWGKPVAQIFIRPQRYTFEFTEKNDFFTLSFFGEEQREALKVCGSTSGRDTDKVAETGLTPAFTKNGNVAFNEAELVLECRKMYVDDFRKEAFTDQSVIPAWYKDGDFHKVYIAEIVNVWKRK
ncbi:MAG: flavin reductase [Paludibacteraceae bacterium]|nr:flavin reductase [Paludibacteraceae bacterium]